MPGKHQISSTTFSLATRRWRISPVNDYFSSGRPARGLSITALLPLMPTPPFSRSLPRHHAIGLTLFRALPIRMILTGMYYARLFDDGPFRPTTSGAALARYATIYHFRVEETDDKVCSYRRVFGFDICQGLRLVYSRAHDMPSEALFDALMSAICVASRYCRWRELPLLFRRHFPRTTVYSLFPSLRAPHRKAALISGHILGTGNINSISEIADDISRRISAPPLNYALLPTLHHL